MRLGFSAEVKEMADQCTARCIECPKQKDIGIENYPYLCAVRRCRYIMEQDDQIKLDPARIPHDPIQREYERTQNSIADKMREDLKKMGR